MRRWRSERGEGNIGCILWVLVLILVVMVAWKAIPVKLSTTKLYDYMDELAKFSAASKPPDELKKMILVRAQDLGIKVDPSNVAVSRKGDSIHMDVQYQVPVSVLGFTYQWNFHHTLDRPIFII